MMNLLKIKQRRLPWWSSGWKSSCQRRGQGFNPWSGKIPHAAGHLNPRATTSELHTPHILCSATRDATARRSLHTATREYSPLTTRESPLVQQQRLSTAIAAAQLLSRVRLCDAMDGSTPGFPVLHHLPEFPQTHVRWVGEAIQPSYLLLPSSSTPLNYK